MGAPPETKKPRTVTDAGFSILYAALAHGVGPFAAGSSVT